MQSKNTKIHWLDTPKNNTVQTSWEDDPNKIVNDTARTALEDIRAKNAAGYAKKQAEWQSSPLGIASSIGGAIADSFIGTPVRAIAGTAGSAWNGIRTILGDKNAGYDQIGFSDWLNDIERSDEERKMVAKELGGEGYKVGSMFGAVDNLFRDSEDFNGAWGKVVDNNNKATGDLLTAVGTYGTLPFSSLSGVNSFRAAPSLKTAIGMAKPMATEAIFGTIQGMGNNLSSGRNLTDTLVSDALMSFLPDVMAGDKAGNVVTKGVFGELSPKMRGAVQIGLPIASQMLGITDALDDNIW